MTTPVSSCGMPRNRYAFRKSIPPVSVRFPGFGSGGAGSWDHAGDAPRPNQTAATSANVAQRGIRPISGIEPPALRRHSPCEDAKEDARSVRVLVRESDPKRANYLIALTTIEELGGRAELLVFYAAVNVPGTEAAGAAERYGDDTGDAEEPELVVLEASRSRQLVVVAPAQPDLDWERNTRLRR